MAPDDATAGPMENIRVFPGWSPLAMLVAPKEQIFRLNKQGLVLLGMPKCAVPSIPAEPERAKQSPNNH